MAKQDNTMLWLLGGAAVVGLALYATQSSAAETSKAVPAAAPGEDDDDAEEGTPTATTRSRQGFSFRRRQERPTDRRRQVVIQQTMQGVGDLGPEAVEELEMQFYQILSLIQADEPDALEDFALWLMQLQPEELAHLQTNDDFNMLSWSFTDEPETPSPQAARRALRQEGRAAAKDMRQAQKQAVKATRRAAKGAAPQAEGMSKYNHQNMKWDQTPKIGTKPPPGPDGRQGFWG